MLDPDEAHARRPPLRACGRQGFGRKRSLRAGTGLGSELEGIEDSAVLELAFAESRVLVTANVSDFEPLLRERAEEGRSHAGVVLVPSSVPNEAFGVLIRGIRKTLGDFSQEDWTNRVEWLRR